MSLSDVKPAFRNVESGTSVSFLDDHRVTLVFNGEHAVDDVTNVGRREITQKVILVYCFLEEVLRSATNNAQICSDLFRIACDRYIVLSQQLV